MKWIVTTWICRKKLKLIASTYIPVNNGQKIPLIRENAAVCQMNDIGYIL